ncbi:hypothetical protein BDZ94DRAFT_1264405 [Collybia nuda]|uniref:Hydrophobin n=1 Tax=Collybia nuda TaxID=64659 RepID=A0A9P5Y4H3_9AGAR|nr:hypothetical protein BDZ94DRAFT_1264405 [Collybia nuda]
MFARASTLFVLALPLFVAASAVPRQEGADTDSYNGKPEEPTTPDITQKNQCTTGPVQCCNSLQSASDLSEHRDLLSSVPDMSKDTMVGVTCSPIEGEGNNSCSAQTYCCNNNNFGGVIALGCAPVTFNIYL